MESFEEDKNSAQNLMTNTPPRICFLDNVRTFIIIGVVVLHGAVIYMNFDPVAFAVRDRQQSLVFTLLAMLLEPTHLTGSFFIAAFFALPSIGKGSSMTFLQKKTIRIGLPWLAGVVLVIPLLKYMTAQLVSGGVAVVFFAAGHGLRRFSRTVFQACRHQAPHMENAGCLLAG
ncbi:MAG: hypothetical protein B7Z55_04675 [Planctomycetales bacterium 12-60-4]|nr:MAG: hypothetical protein B7Z55_04675 [Planctomycetales bacterium 12-60-4]